MAEEKSETAVYRAYDGAGRLLYVGVAANWGARWAQHSERSPWFQHVARLDVKWCGRRTEALAQEARAVADEAPLFNVTELGWDGRLRCDRCKCSYQQCDGGHHGTGWCYHLGEHCYDWRCQCGAERCWPDHRCMGLLVRASQVAPTPQS